MPTTDITRAQRFFQRGLYYYEHASWEKAGNNFKDAVDLYPEHVAARMHLGVALAKQRRYYDAVRVLEAGRQQSLDDASRLKLLRLLGTICVIREDLPAAEFYLKLAAQLAPENAALSNQLANVLCRAHSFEEGFDLFLQASQQRPEES